MKPEDQSDIFCIFHDGIIKKVTKKLNDIELVVEIEYLSKMINFDFRDFVCVFTDCAYLGFYVKGKDKPINDLDKLSSMNLQIAYANNKENDVIIECFTDDCGGDLVLKTENIVIFDEEGHEVQLNELDELCRKYWNGEKV